jgi:hypothetical protein
MTCYHPLKGWRSKESKAITFNVNLGFIDKPVTVPCGQCVGCRLERSRQWAIRCMHEASLYESNCFITLTYDNDYLPFDASLHLDHYQKFMKRLRKKFGANIRFYHCGEYGEKYFRPHYHACLFNFDFDDKKLFKIVNDQKLYTSAKLQELWPYGFSTIGSVTFESAAYVARYIMKKVTGSRAESHYERVCQETGEVIQLKPEYTTMSRRPGIGKGWYDKFKKDVYPHDFVVVRGNKVKPPKYYDNILKIEELHQFEAIKNKRKKLAKKFAKDNNSERLLVKEFVKKSQIKKLVRSLD